MSRSNVVLLLVVLSLGTFYAWSKLHKMEEEKKKFEASRYFPEKKETDVESIDVTCTDPHFHYLLKRVGDRWFLDGHLANQEKSPQLVSCIIEMTTEKEINPSPKPEDIKEFGMDKPSYTFTLTANGGKDMGTVILGKRAPGGNHYYGQWKKGGAISTVPSALFSPLEEEPKDLREMSPLPIQPAAVDRFSFELSDQKGEMTRPEGKDEGYEMVKPARMTVDETRASDLMYLLKDLKVARFLGDTEKTDLGTPVATYRAHEVGSDPQDKKGSKVDFVAQFCQPVAVTPKLRYGRRYLTDPGSDKPLPGTEERFVIEMLPDSKALHATVAGFEDRRLMKLDPDKVKAVVLTTAKGVKVEVERLPQGGWRLRGRDGGAEDAALGKLADKLVWAVRDLRSSDSKAVVEPTGKDEWQVLLEMKEGSSNDFRFGRDKSGKPFVGFADKTVLLQEDLVPALDDAAKALTEKPGAATPPAK